MNHSLRVMEARRIGCDASTRLRNNTSGEIIAAFQRTLYVGFPGGVVCIGEAKLGDGPLNVLTETAVIDDWRALAAPGLPAAIADGYICISSTRIRFSDADVWTPPPTPPLEAVRLQEGLAILFALLQDSLPDEGLARLILPGSRVFDSVQEAAVGSIQSLRRWAFGPPGQNPMTPDIAVAGLLGLGPGLTPSGDDFLAGFAVALRVIGANRQLRSLSRSISIQAGERTNDISAAHLSSALGGRLSNDMHCILNGILDGEKEMIAKCLDAFAAAGHTSPWDALAGIVAVLAITKESMCLTKIPD